jgi:aspartyl-tRNA(Asn)/glutamyl-tRNA(Gln) amidotransferase subunit A
MDSDEQLAWLPVWRLAQLFRSRELSPVEYAEFLLQRADEMQGLGAFLSFFEDDLRSQAAQAERTMGPDSPPLHGVPISVKDNIATRGRRTTYGSRLLADHVPGSDAPAVERLKAAGAIVFAKTNMPEFAMQSRSVNELVPEARNPWDQNRTAGGSSGGSAAAVAAGLGPASLATDGGGSIRIPAAFNGVFGLFPSRGRVPSGGGLFTNPSSGLGPITRDVRDAALMLKFTAGHDPRDPFSALPADPEDYLGMVVSGIGGARLAWSPDLGRVRPAEAGVVDVAFEAAQVLREHAGSFAEIDIHLEDPLDLRDPERAYAPEIVEQQLREVSDYPDLAAFLATIEPSRLSLLSDHVLNVRSRVDVPAYLDGLAPRFLSASKTRLADLFSTVDLLLTPTIDRTAFLIDGDKPTSLEYVSYTNIVNLSGYCAASVPAGFHNEMPVGLQIIGRPGDEARVLQAARILEIQRPWTDARPPCAVPS